LTEARRLLVFKGADLFLERATERTDSEVRFAEDVVERRDDDEMDGFFEVVLRTGAVRTVFREEETDFLRDFDRVEVRETRVFVL